MISFFSVCFPPSPHRHPKIDASVIPVMTDSDLSKDIPKAGDRIATVAYCRQSKGSTDAKSRCDAIVERLKSKPLSPEESGTAKKTQIKSWIRFRQIRFRQ